nr:uncharacterized protein LOC129274827 [Lytechinus pictus]
MRFKPRQPVLPGNRTRWLPPNLHSNPKHPKSHPDPSPPQPTHNPNPTPLLPPPPPSLPGLSSPKPPSATNLSGQVTPTRHNHTPNFSSLSLNHFPSNTPTASVLPPAVPLPCPSPTSETSPPSPKPTVANKVPPQCLLSPCRQDPQLPRSQLSPPDSPPQNLVPKWTGLSPCPPSPPEALTQTHAQNRPT